MKLYLAGPINDITGAEAAGWRDRVRQSLADLVDVSNPLDRDVPSARDDAFKNIVEGDKLELDASDVVLAYCSQPSYGTAMEILYCWERSIPILVVLPPDQVVSPWVRYHATEIHNGLDSALESVRFRAGTLG